jgi:hypothetical protein
MTVFGWQVKRTATPRQLVMAIINSCFPALVISGELYRSRNSLVLQHYGLCFPDALKIPATSSTPNLASAGRRMATACCIIGCIDYDIEPLWPLPPFFFLLLRHGASTRCSYRE